MTVFVAAFLPLVIALGFWQLARGAEKRAMEMEYLAQLTALPVAATSAGLAQSFRRVRLQGRFADEMFMVDNQVSQGVTGYWLVQVFSDISGRRFLTNRGFIAAPSHREDLPAVTTPADEVVVLGVVWPFTGLVPVLDEDLWTDDWPKRVQRLDVARMSALVDTQPVEVRLEPGQPGVARAAPFAQVLGDARHMGYAATWFGLAVALSIGYLMFGVTNARERRAAGDDDESVAAEAAEAKEG